MAAGFCRTAAVLVALAGPHVVASLRTAGGAGAPAAEATSPAQLAAHCQSLRASIRTSPHPPARDDGREDYLWLFQTGEHVQQAGASSTEERRDAHFQARLGAGHVDVTVARYREDTAWTGALRAKGLNVTVRQAEGLDETIAFVKHLIESYDSNTSMFAFLHGKAPNDWHSPVGLLDYIEEIDPAKVKQYGGYASLNHPYMSKWNCSQHRLLEYRVDCSWRDDLWVKMMKERWALPDIGAFAGHAGRYCCSQFVLTREALRSYPKAFYTSLLERVTKREPWDHSSWKTIGRSMAMLWHVMFTGKVNEPKYSYQAIAACPPTGCLGKRPQRHAKGEGQA